MLLPAGLVSSLNVQTVNYIGSGGFLDTQINGLLSVGRLYLKEIAQVILFYKFNFLSVLSVISMLYLLSYVLFLCIV